MYFLKKRYGYNLLPVLITIIFMKNDFTAFNKKNLFFERNVCKYKFNCSHSWMIQLQINSTNILYDVAEGIHWLKLLYYSFFLLHKFLFLRKFMDMHFSQIFDWLISIF